MSQDQQSNEPSANALPTWTPERRAQVERQGREAIERMRNAAQHHLANAGPQRPIAPMPFEPVMGKCEKHGEYPLNMQDAEGVVRWHSPICQACARQGEASRLLERAAIPPRFAHCTFDSFRATTPSQVAALEICRDYAANFARYREAGTCLILRGNPGTGKNHLATAIAREVLAKGKTVLNAKAYEVIDRIRETWGGQSQETAQQVIERFGALDLLIIDEVGRQYRAKDGTDSPELFKVIDHRYVHVRPTIVISNLDRDGLMGSLGQAAYDRLREGGAALLNFDWDSARA